MCVAIRVQYYENEKRKTFQTRRSCKFLAWPTIHVLKVVVQDSIPEFSRTGGGQVSNCRIGDGYHHGACFPSELGGICHMLGSKTSCKSAHSQVDIVCILSLVQSCDFCKQCA